MKTMQGNIMSKERGKIPGGQQSVSHILSQNIIFSVEGQKVLPTGHIIYDLNKIKLYPLK